MCVELRIGPRQEVPGADRRRHVFGLGGGGLQRRFSLLAVEISVPHQERAGTLSALVKELELDPI